MKKITLLTILSLLLMFTVVSAQKGTPQCDNNGPHGKAQFQNCDQQGPHGGKAGMRSGHNGRNFHKQGMGQRGQKGHRGDGLQRIIRMADRLELSEKQVAELKDMSFDFQMEKVDMQADIKKAQIKLKALHRDDASERDIFNAIDEMADLKAKMQKMRFSHKNAAKDVLTDEQMEKLKSFHNKREFNIEKEIYFDDDDDDGNSETKIIKRRGFGRG